jgi:hypothetical protein
MFAFAGLWDAWKDGEGHWLQSFSIVTTVANELIAVSYLSRLLSSATKELTSLAQQGKASLPEKSMLAGVGAHAESGVVISDFHLVSRSS